MVTLPMHQQTSSDLDRCSSTGRTCDGYKQGTNSNYTEGLGVFSVSEPLRRFPTPQIAGDSVQYLEFYHHCSGSTISSGYDKDFWSRTSFQIAQTELCVRHALIALAYLTKTESGSLKDARSRFVSGSKQMTLFSHYNKAVKLLVQRMSEASYSPEIGLVCCVLFICMEFLRGNYDTAFAHYDSGINIISAYRKSRRLPSSTKTPGTSLIEETLIPIFIRLMGTAMYYGFRTEQALILISDIEEIQSSVFDSVKDAQSSLHNLRNQIGLFVRDVGLKQFQSKPITREDLEHQEDFLEAHRVWFGALEKLESSTTLSTQDAITAHILKAQYYFMYLLTACITHPDQMACDEYLEGFKAMIHHARIVLDARERDTTPSAAANFTFEVNLILGLYMVACHCRCPITRREAIALLERNPPREGLWDAQQHAAIARRVVELEEAEVDPATGWPVERTRIWSTIIRGDMDEHGRFLVFFAIGHWGEGRGIPPLPEDMVLSGGPHARMLKEWFVL
jgi:hypothetical protein